MLENIPLQTCPVGPTTNAFSMALLVLIVILVGIIILLLRKIEAEKEKYIFKSDALYSFTE